MSGLLTIELKQVRFFAYHGIHEEEKRIGNDFEVTVKVFYQSTEKVINTIDKTVNYVQLFELVQEQMQVPTELLETIVMAITEKIHNSFSLVKKVKISITKLNPPIPRFVGSVGVSYLKEF